LCSAAGAGNLGDATASPSKNCFGKIGSIWANLFGFGINLGNIGETWVKVIRFGQNQNLHPQKH